MNPTTMSTGLLPLLGVIACALSVPVSLVLLHVYKRAVARAMRAGAPAIAGPDSAPRSAPPFPLRLQTLSSDAGVYEAETTTSIHRFALYGCWRAALACAFAGACYAAIMTTTWLVSTRDQEIPPIKVALLFWTYFWPVVVAILIIAAYDRRRRLQVLASYFLPLVGIILIVKARNPGIGPLELLLYWIVTNGPPTVAIGACLYRPVRAVGPLVLAFLLALSIGSQAILLPAMNNHAFLKWVAEVGFAMGLSGTATFVVMILAGMSLFGILLGWPVLRLLGRCYDKKLLSDQSIILDALWVIFGVTQSIYLAFHGPLWMLSGLAAFLGFKAASVFAYRRMFPNRRGTGSKTLLLLRVFALAKRSERFFDRLRRHWQYAGTIFMIAGPDLVTTTVEPHEFLDFLRWRVGRHFVSDTHDLERRLARVDRLPDPDGRYRINEFFCHNDTWQATMTKLASSSDCVLMDLRSFSPETRGCIYELSRLLDAIDLNQVVLLIDRTTDIGFLEATIQGLWQNVRGDSPNRATPARSVRLFSLTSQNERELHSLVGLLQEAASAFGTIGATAGRQMHSVA